MCIEASRAFGRMTRENLGSDPLIATSPANAEACALITANFDTQQSVKLLSIAARSDNTDAHGISPMCALASGF
jgi:hypothetical protein